MKIIINRATNPFYNLALEKFFLMNAPEELFILWQNGASVIIGKNQILKNEVNLNVVQQKHITVARRITGGGAVYHDLGNVNFTFILPLGEEYVHDSIQKIVQALKKYGIDAEVSGRNDILANGCKISGMAQIQTENWQLLHGTLLYDVHLDTMQAVLTPSQNKMEKHGVRSVKSRVVNIKEIMEQDVNTEFFFSFLERHFKEYNRLEEKIVTEEEKKHIQVIISELSEQQWIYKDELIQKIFDVDDNIKFSLIVERDVIKEIHFWGDFIDAKNISILEKKLQGCAYKKEDIYKVLKRNESIFREMDLNILCDKMIKVR